MLTYLLKYQLPLFLSIFILASCDRADDPSENPVREKELPEKVESELLEIASKPWKPVLDTVRYFNTNLLLKSKTKGFGPDSVYYELKTELQKDRSVNMKLFVEDSCFVSAHGSISPLEMSVSALNTDFTIRKTSADSTSIIIDNIEVIAPNDIIINKNATTPLLYQGSRVGYLTREDFENEDYSTGTYFVVHYYGDQRTFAFYDNIL